MLSGQGPTAETAVNCPNYTAITPGTVSETAEQGEGTGCVYGKEVKSLPTQLEEKGLTWRAYVEDMENGGAIGQPFRCRKPTLGGPHRATPRPAVPLPQADPRRPRRGDPRPGRSVRELAQPCRLLLRDRRRRRM